MFNHNPFILQLISKRSNSNMNLELLSGCHIGQSKCIRTERLRFFPIYIKISRIGRTRLRNVACHTEGEIKIMSTQGIKYHRSSLVGKQYLQGVILIVDIRNTAIHLNVCIDELITIDSILKCLIIGNIRR